MKKILLPLFAVVLFSFSVVSAHQPVWGDAFGPIEIEDTTTSFAFYQTLQADEVDVFFVEGRQGENFRGGIQIPDIEALREYDVSVALFGPGLPAPEESQLPPEHPEDLGALIYPGAVSEDFFEPFTQAQYWGRQEFNVTLPEDGTYYVIVWQPEGKAGKYVIDTGYAERFGLFDIFLFPIWWVRVALFHQYYARLGIAGVIVLVIAFFAYRRFKKE